ncbi:MAG: tripartite tricarboxylate transporter TctB family protein [Alphaproteobacteria bacterium]|nr:tripartite tricarboxylate transporter TctB family protein [Alphaproteobacteria bacterium]
MLLNRNFLGGLLFIALGLATIAVARGYPMGSAMRMGPGYFPQMIGAGIAILGLALAVQGALAHAAAEERVAGIAFRPITAVMAAIAAFAWLIEGWGLLAAVTALIVLARLSRSEGSTLELLLSVLALNAIAMLVFVTGLNMTLRVGPW